MVYCVGLTGNIASGKSTVAKIFTQLGIDVINADAISKELTAKDQPAFVQIIHHYGKAVLNEDGELNRKQLRDIIFSDQHERTWLEQLLHPLIRQRIQERVENCCLPYCIVEIPLLINKNDYPYINRILLITASVETQIARVMQRDHCAREQALAILAVQPNIKTRMDNADDVLINNLSLEELRIAVTQLHHQYLLFARGNH